MTIAQILSAWLNPALCELCGHVWSRGDNAAAPGAPCPWCGHAPRMAILKASGARQRHLRRSRAPHQFDVLGREAISALDRGGEFALSEVD